MDALETVRAVIRARRSVRRGYTDKPVSRETLLAIVEAGTQAPSGSNTQSVRFLVETRPAEIRKLAAIRRDADKVLSMARALVLVFVDRSKAKSGEVWGQLGYQDSAAALQNMLLVATAAGLGSCWISAYRNMEGGPLLSGLPWAAALDSYALPASTEIMGIVALGHTGAAPAGDETHRGRPVARRPVGDYVLAWDGAAV